MSTVSPASPQESVEKMFGGQGFYMTFDKKLGRLNLTKVIQQIKTNPDLEKRSDTEIVRLMADVAGRTNNAEVSQNIVNVLTEWKDVSEMDRGTRVAFELAKARLSAKTEESKAEGIEMKEFGKKEARPVESLRLVSLKERAIIQIKEAFKSIKLFFANKRASKRKGTLEEVLKLEKSVLEKIEGKEAGTGSLSVASAEVESATRAPALREYRGEALDDIKTILKALIQSLVNNTGTTENPGTGEPVLPSAPPASEMWWVGKGGNPPTEEMQKAIDMLFRTPIQQ